VEGKRGLGSGGVIAKLLKWAKHELGYVPKDLAGSMKLPDRYRLLVSSTEGTKRISLLNGRTYLLLYLKMWKK
jgi:hypothetical protein